MKKILTIILILIGVSSFAQTSTINPDTVCYGTSGSTYTIPSVGAVVYTWTVAAPGIITSGQGTNAIVVDWSLAPAGLINTGVSVTAATACPGPPVTLNVFILNVIPIIDPLGPYCAGSPCVTLTATPIGGSWSGSGFSAPNQFCPSLAAIGNNQINYSYQLAGCTFNATSTIVVTNTIPIGPISHN